MKILQTFGLGNTPTQATGTVTAPTQQTSITDLTNIRYVRTFVLNNGFVILSHSNIAAGISLADLAQALITLEPSLTWPPIVTTQPSAAPVTAPTPIAMQFVVNSEVTVNYQWYLSTDSGVSFNPVTNTGVYTGALTFQLNISDSTGLNGYQYKCVATNVSGATTSSVVTLVVH